jgi:hypothetical protein
MAEIQRLFQPDAAFDPETIEVLAAALDNRRADEWIGVLPRRTANHCAALPDRRSDHHNFKFPLYLYNIWIARAADQFVWSRLARKVQGNDLSGRDLSGVARSPFNSRRWAQLPYHISSQMTEMCDAKAAHTLSGVRKLLGTAYLAQGQGSVISPLLANRSPATA